MPPRQPKPQDKTGQLDLAGFARRARDRRELLGITQVKIARHVGCSSSMVRRYLRGENFPTGLKLVRLAEVLEVSLDYLVLGKRIGGLSDRRLLDLLRGIEQLPPTRLADFLRIVQAYLEPQEADPAVAAPRRAVAP